MIIELIVFMVKVKEIYRVADIETSTLIVDVSTKIINLALISLLLTLLHFITTLLYIKYQTTLIGWIDAFATVIDIFGNIIAILLCFKSHKNTYYRICKCTDYLVRLSCSCCINVFHEQKKQTQIVKMMTPSEHNIV